MATGLFIVIDGGEGSGKTVMMRHLRSMYSDERVRFTREPGGSPYGEKVRETMLCPEAKDADGVTQFGLIWAARRDHMRNLILPTLAAGTHVISDRFDSSTYAYQVRGQESPELERLFYAMRQTVLRDRTPDLYIFLDVDPQEGVKRAKGRGGEVTHFDEREIDFHHRVRDGFLSFLADVSHEVIDANQPQEVVARELEACVRSYLEHV